MSNKAICKDCGTEQSEEQRELDKDCRCGGTFVPEHSYNGEVACDACHNDMGCERDDRGLEPGEDTDYENRLNQVIEAAQWSAGESGKELAAARSEIANGYDAIFGYVPEANGEDGKPLLLAEKIGLLANQLENEVLAHTETKGRLVVSRALVGKLTSDLEEAIFARDTYRKGMETAQNGLRYPRYGDTAGLLDRMAEVLEYSARETGSDSLIAPHARRAAERIREALGVKL